ncbi:MAG: hypothetical protein IJE17_04650 [Clostridia bacterium]|nr:hypothetical protein [Clostridia bacterium]
MNEMKKRLDAELSQLEWKNEHRLQVLKRIDQGGKPIVKKRFSAAISLALVLIVLSAGALAAGTIFSPRYDAARLANEALYQQYGLTPEMMTLFHRSANENADGSVVVIYETLDPYVRTGENRLGTYTVVIRDGKAQAQWSLDGVDTAGGLSARAWGKEQLNQYIHDYGSVQQYLKENHMLGDVSMGLPAMIWEEYEELQKKNRQAVENAAKITLAEARDLARQAIIGEYGLTEAQGAALAQGETDSIYAMEYTQEDEKPCVRLYFHLTQGDSWQEKDGIYVVIVNMESGVIEDMIYDSGLAGNG